MWLTLAALTALAQDAPTTPLDVHISKIHADEVAAHAELLAWRHVVENRDPLSVALAMNQPLVAAQLEEVIEAKRELREISLVYGDKMPQKVASVRRDHMAQEELRRHLAMVLDAREIELAVLTRTRLELEAVRDGASTLGSQPSKAAATVR